MRKKTKFLYLFEGVLILMTVSMIFILVGCTKEDSDTDGPTSVINVEKIQEESDDQEKVPQTQEAVGEEEPEEISMQEKGSEEESVSGTETVGEEASVEIPIQEKVSEEQKVSNTEASEGEASGTDEKTYYGHWKIVDFAAPGIVALSKDEMEGYMNIQLTYTKDSFTVDNGNPESPVYSETTVTKEEFADSYNNQVTFDSLQVSGDFMTEVSISNSAEFGSMFYVADRDTLYITLDGVFFKAERQSE